ncbi:hypothetical protein OV208_21390 [Corallococcus sp. bb12-1]|uniref:M12 family metallo-peptidase n=1 Tax=Corallococcus sp. bb12-1 TaxID=2996784 RepID=UPI00227072CC|nr:M12 family metallo-peptidase [Corallococcus sp. bb12-1]MCY1043885.1 hypothetical protein [Corallococcus sp. bb12-1]
MLERPWETNPWATQRVWEHDGGDPGNTFRILAVFMSDCAFNEDQFERIDRDVLIGNIRRCVDEMNDAFARSGVGVRGNLVSVVQLAAPGPFLPTGMYRDALLGEPANEQERDDRLQGITPPELVEHYGDLRRLCGGLRAEHEAHVVLLVTGGGGDPIAGALGATHRANAFVVVPHTKLLEDFTPAHEIGHLFGCEHNRESVRVRAHASCYGFVTPYWRTIMAYNPHHDRDLPVIGHFSNPAVDHDDEAHGPLATGAANANNVAQINLYTPTILGLRG